MYRKGIILAGGKGTRLRPATYSVSKPLLPVYDKPMVYYSLSVLMQAGIREIAVITTPEDQALFQRVLGDGSQWGVQFEWIVQPSADGIAHAYILAEGFLGGHPSALVLGDNLFLGHGLQQRLSPRSLPSTGGTIFTCEVRDPERYGVAGYSGNRVTEIVEKPTNPPSNSAITGLYFLDGDASRRAHGLRPSDRGELEIVSLLEAYLADGALTVERLGAEIEWYDAGTHDALLEASQAVQRLQKGGELFGSPDEAAFLRGWSSGETVARAIKKLGKTAYGSMLSTLVDSAAAQSEAA